jgi:GTP-binding protein EngB required for normal cell division
LAQALEITADRVDSETTAKVSQAVDGVRERLALGVDHTVVALAGGTGSGKSSLFNKISRLAFAVVGVKRPTTARVTAASWDDGAEELLDWIGVDRERRIVQAGELELGDALDGLVLLDLPDHDSVQREHRDAVDKVLPLVDLLIWVVDPQKYADDALHSGYLRASVGMEASMLVLLNQIDTVPLGRRDELRVDLDRLLAEDGLVGVPVMSVSASTGEGIAEVRELLVEVCERRTVAAGRAAGELDAASRLLASKMPADVLWDLPKAVERELPALVEATSLEAVAGQVEAAVRNGYGRPEFPLPDRDAIAMLRSRWLTRAGASLPSGWQRSLGETLPTGDVLRQSVAEAVDGLGLDVSGPPTARLMRRLAWGLCAAGVAVLIFAGLATAGLPRLAAPWPIVAWVLGAALVAGGVGIGLTARAVRRRLARRRNAGLTAAGNAVLEQVLVDGLGAPTRDLITAYQTVRKLAASARDIPVAANDDGAHSSSTGLGRTPVSTGSTPEQAAPGDDDPPS